MIALLLDLALAAPLVSVEAEPARTLITNVGVLGTDGALTGIHDVVLADGRIEALLPVGEGWDVPVERTVDGSGATLLPGLIDVHVHLSSTYAVPGKLRVPKARSNLEQLLYWGVTTVLDLSQSRDTLERYERRVDAGRWVGPEIYASGRPFAAPDGHPTSTVRAMYPGLLVKLATRGGTHHVATSDEVDDGLAEEGASGFTKVMLDSLPPGAPVLSDEALSRLRIGATALGDVLLAHVGRPEDVQRALDLPVDALAHLPWAGALSASQVERIAGQELPVIPTLTVWESVGVVHAGAPFDGPMERASLTAKQQRDLEWAREGKAKVDGELSEWAAGLSEAQPEREGNARRVYEAGATVLVGSDSPMVGLGAGIGTHRELDALVRAGLPNEAVLSAATWENSRFLDSDAHFGAVKTGWEADLLLVEGDPTQDLAALQAIRAVWVDGRRVDRGTKE